MKLRAYFFYLFILLFSKSYGQGYFPTGARAISMGTASVTQGDVWAFQNNPGALAMLEEFRAGITYENRFLTQELQSSALALAAPIKKGVISFGAQYFGYSQYQEMKAGAGYSLQLSEKFFAGVQLNYLQLNIPNYIQKSVMTAEAGLIAKVNENWQFGFSVYNIGRAKLSSFEDDRFSTVMRFGSSYRFSKKLLIAGEFEKDIDNLLRVKAGIEYEMINHFYLRGGSLINPSEYTFGIGYALKKMRLDFGTRYIPVLGWSPHFSLIFVNTK